MLRNSLGTYCGNGWLRMRHSSLKGCKRSWGRCWCLGAFQTLEMSIDCLNGICKRLQCLCEGHFGWIRGCVWIIGLNWTGRDCFVLGLQHSMMGFVCVLRPGAVGGQVAMCTFQTGALPTITLAWDWSWVTFRTATREISLDFNLSRIYKPALSWRAAM